MQFKQYCKATQWDVPIPGVFSKARVTYPHQVFHTSILTCLHSCPEVQQCCVPMEIISLPPKTSKHLCSPPVHSLSLSRCLYFPSFNKSDFDKKQGCLQYFSNAFRNNSFCPSLLESPLGIYMHLSTFKDKKTILQHSWRQNNLRGCF